MKGRFHILKEKSYQALSNTELASFCSQTAMILHAGISPAEGIGIMMEDAASQEEKDILAKIQDTLNLTGIFSQALKDSGVFPEYMLHMVNLGEQAGRLDETMESLGLHYEREANITSAIRSAVTYPCIMIGMMLLVVLVLVTRVLPVFNQVFVQFGQSLTGVSRTLMNIGSVMNRYAVVFVVLLAVLAALFLYFTRTSSGKKQSAQIFSHLKFTRSFSHKNAACHFASGMALTLKSGLTPEEGLQMSGALTSNPAFHRQLDECKSLVENGMPLADALSRSGIFSGVYARMVTVADRTGSLDEVMQKIASKYEEELDESLNSAISVLEPTLVAVLSIIVGLILLSVMMPLMGILSGI